MSLVVAIGDVHSHLPLALQGLEEIEGAFGSPVAQVFSVGDFGLFLEPDDWRFLSGPGKYKHPERSAETAEAWRRWPFSMIGGSKERFHTKFELGSDQRRLPPTAPSLKLARFAPGSPLAWGGG